MIEEGGIDATRRELERAIARNPSHRVIARKRGALSGSAIWPMGSGKLSRADGCNACDAIRFDADAGANATRGYHGEGPESCSAAIESRSDMLGSLAPASAVASAVSILLLFKLCSAV